MAGSITYAKLGFMENGRIMMDSKKSNALEVACLNSTQPNSERHYIAFMFNFLRIFSHTINLHNKKFDWPFIVDPI